MAKLRRIALFAERSPLFINLLMGLKAGFEAHGVEAFASWPPLGGRDLPAFLANFQPDAVLEINRSRDHIADCELPVPHLCWIQDFQYDGRDVVAGLGGSDITYLMMPPDMLGIDPAALGAWSFLWPGVNVDCLAAADPGWPLAHDLSFVGHMYPPPPDDVLDAPMVFRGVSCGRVRDVYEAFLAAGHIESGFSVARLDAFLAQRFAAYGVDVTLKDIEPSRRYLFHEVMLRIKDRRHIAEQMLKVGGSVGFYGSAGWGQWPRFAPHYHGDLLEPRSLARVYRATTLNVHCCVWPFHFRPLDCMGCGAAVMVNQVEHPLAERLFHDAFEPGRDFISYRIEDFAEAAARALADREALRRIGRNALDRIAGAHTTRHRAAQILRDLDAL